jgi:hypothetical protein
MFWQMGRSHLNIAQAICGYIHRSYGLPQRVCDRVALVMRSGDGGSVHIVELR